MSFLVLKAYLKLIHFDLFLARGNFAALYNEVRSYPVEEGSASRSCRTNLCRGGHGFYLVLERSALLAALGGNRVSFEAVRSTRSDGHWCATDALQGARLG